MRRGINICLSLAFFMLSCGQGQNENKTATTTTVTEQGPVNSNGKQLFINNCQRCHELNQDKMGPKLAGVLSRWNNDTAQVVAFIKDPQQLISSGKNTYATQLYTTWNGAQMPSFSNLSDADIKDIISYINKGAE